MKQLSCLCVRMTAARDRESDADEGLDQESQTCMLHGSYPAFGTILPASTTKQICQNFRKDGKSPGSTLKRHSGVEYITYFPIISNLYIGKETIPVREGNNSSQVVVSLLV